MSFINRPREIYVTAAQNTINKHQHTQQVLFSNINFSKHYDYDYIRPSSVSSYMTLIIKSNCSWGKRLF